MSYATLAVVFPCASRAMSSSVVARTARQTRLESYPPVNQWLIAEMVGRGSLMRLSVLTLDPGWRWKSLWISRRIRLGALCPYRLSTSTKSDSVIVIGVIFLCGEVKLSVMSVEVCSEVPMVVKVSWEQKEKLILRAG